MSAAEKSLGTRPRFELADTPSWRRVADIALKRLRDDSQLSPPSFGDNRPTQSHIGDFRRLSSGGKRSSSDVLDDIRRLNEADAAKKKKLKNELCTERYISPTQSGSSEEESSDESEEQAPQKKPFLPQCEDEHSNISDVLDHSIGRCKDKTGTPVRESPQSPAQERPSTSSRRNPSAPSQSSHSEDNNRSSQTPQRRGRRQLASRLRSTVTMCRSRSPISPRYESRRSPQNRGSRQSRYCPRANHNEVKAILCS